MIMHWIDWSIVIGLLGVITAVAFYAKNLSKSVTDYLAAGRCAGRYLLCISERMGALGALYFISRFEMFYDAGFSSEWWGMLNFPVAMLISVSGFVIYRYRQVRSLTLNQFFEIRYSKNFRVFVGMLAWFSGIIQFGIYPAVGARFFIYFCGLPEAINVGGITISTYPLIMFILISIALFFTFIGGQIVVILTDFIQGSFVNITLLVIFVVLAMKFDWSVIVEALKTAPEGKSMLDPMDTGNIQKFNIFFFVIGSLRVLYNQGSWQGIQGYACSAKNSHELRMGKVISNLRWITEGLLFVMLPLCAYTFMHHANFAAGAEAVTERLGGIDNEYLQGQLGASVALRQLLPVGIIGAFAAVMLAAFISTHDTYLLAWGSVFVQDVIMPFRKTPFTPRQHMLLIRLSILFVAIFIFLFSYFYRQTTEIMFFFAFSGAVYLGGVGAVVIGGLYWSRGSTTGAWASMITGTVMGLAGFIATQANLLPPSITGQVVFFFTMLASVFVYVVISLLTSKKPFNLEKMLHRGKYAVKADDATVRETLPGRWSRMFGITKEFTLADKIMYFGSMSWCMVWFFVFLFGTLYALSFDVSVDVWAKFWHIKIWIFFVFGICITTWLVLGGLRDMLFMFKHLKTAKRNERDDGRVVDHHNLADDVGNQD